MFTKVLIANRGDIAVRIIRACREMGIESVAVYSEADKNALHTELADYAVCIGPAKASDSYLNMHNILSAAVVSGAQAIHPGVGFLAENSTFASMCKECHIKFIGPDPHTIVQLGNKANARAMMINAGVPVIPGSDGIVKTMDEAHASAKALGFPVMVKASAGGGGKGIRIIRSPKELEQAYVSARAEAIAAFGDDSLYMEKLIENPRHIEVQILGDAYGHVIHLGERDCSLQRRNQKVLEEAPSTVLSADIRAQMGDAAVRAAQAVSYQGAGTIEFLFKNNAFYFMEMNTRIQVEHPVTEMITGIDIVKEQIKIASGRPMKLKQSDIQFDGHAMECRINAENPKKDFMPSPGRINYLLLPGGCSGLRVDSAIYAGCDIPPNYDSMVAKVITRGHDRPAAIAKMKRALHEFVVRGIETNIDFQLDILNHTQFVQGDFTTSFIQDEIIDKLYRPVEG